MSYDKDLSGCVFGKLRVLNLVPSDSRGTSWLCECDCGNTTVVSRRNLVSGNTKSCGCLIKEANKVTSKKRTRKQNSEKSEEYKKLYMIWGGMKNRCYNENAKGYEHYGGNGITVCSEWLHDFHTFYNWSMSVNYKIGLSIDRIDNDKGYSPDNCRWVEKGEQQRNRKNVEIYEYEGEKACLAEWARRKGISYKTLYSRMHKDGYSFEESLEMGNRKSNGFIGRNGGNEIGNNSE